MIFGVFVGIRKPQHTGEVLGRSSALLGGCVQEVALPAVGLFWHQEVAVSRDRRSAGHEQRSEGLCAGSCEGSAASAGEGGCD